MQKHNNNLFSEKFRLLNSQEHVEDIKWSSSESSDTENIPRYGKCSSLHTKVQRKRKRKNTGPKNISNLSVTILDTSNDLKQLDCGQKSPTFAPSQIYTRPKKCFKEEPSSPVLLCKVTQKPKGNILQRSPILPIKHTPPKISSKVRISLFQGKESEQKVTEKIQENKTSNFAIKSEPLNISNKCKNSSNSQSCSSIKDELKGKVKLQDICSKQSNKCLIKSINPCQQSTATVEDDISEVKIKVEIPESQEELPETQQKCSEDSLAILKSQNIELIKRTKSYFENHFSSGNASQSQHSIGDCLTQKNSSKTSEEVEIISIMTQVNSNRSSFQSQLEFVSKNPSPLSSQSAEYGTEKSKKIRYKKDGLAYRLNQLVKKQNAKVLLWQHERFLADNSNFLLPKGEHVVFLIQKVNVKYGSYLLEGIDVNDANVIILVSSIYVKDSTITENMVFKLYEPYKVLDYQNDCKVIVNVCKFECVAFKMF